MRLLYPRKPPLAQRGFLTHNGLLRPELSPQIRPAICQKKPVEPLLDLQRLNK